MLRIHGNTITGAAAACLLVTVLACLTCVWPASLPVVQPASMSFCPRSHSPFETALAEAREWRQRAAVEVHRRREELEAWDPAAADPGRRDSAAHEAWRLRQLAADPRGFLDRAQTAALHAVDLAQTARERYRAAVLMAAIEHELGQPDQELQEARTLVALQPRSELSLLILRRALLCSGRPSLAAGIDKQLAALRQREGRVTRSVPRWSPSTAALLDSKRRWIEAWNAAGAEQSQREVWDPAASAYSRPGEQAGMTERPELELADKSARRSLALAQSKPETYRSVRWLARIECALGHQREELRLAKQLVLLAPRDEGSLTCLLQAAKCNGLKDLEKQVLAALKSWHPSPATGAEPRVSIPGAGKTDAADRHTPGSFLLLTPS